MAGPPAGVAEAEGRLRLELLLAAALLRVDMTGLGLAAKPLLFFALRLSEPPRLVHGAILSPQQIY